MVLLLDLPQELLEHVLSYLPPKDIVSYGRTCRSCNSFVAPTNKLLWQSAFLQLFDDPHESWSSLTPTARRLNLEVEQKWDWHSRLKRRLHTLRTVTDSFDGNKTSLSYHEMVEAILEMIETARPGAVTFTPKLGRRHRLDGTTRGNINLLPTLYHWHINMDQLVRLGDPETCVPELPTCPDAMNPGHIFMSPTRPTTRSMSAARTVHAISERPEAACKLHALAGLSTQEKDDVRALGLARRIVYDWDHTTEENDYGPFKTDGNVDWRRLEAVVSVATGHFSRAVQSRMSLPQGFEYSVPHLTRMDPNLTKDWAGVTGSWCGTYVFLNWEDLLHYNARADLESRPSLEDGPESCGGLMKLELKINDELSDDAALKAGLPFCEDFPPLYFHGVSRSWDFQMATGVRGMCCLTPNGREVRWKFIIK